MSNENSLSLPESTCAYERYDPETMRPLNDQTYIRLQELGWSAQDFTDQTVLDIGCNSGLLTIQALKLGARKVDACDVQQPFVDFFSRVVQAKHLPVTVTRAAFDKLDPEQRKADIVLFMEVLHWAVSQGMELRDVIRRLADLTGKLLYIEFPWSVSEPSIKAQTKLTAETYSADAVLDELTRYFKTVRVVRFMRYFGFASESQRILVEAREKRPEASILAQLPGAYSLDLALSRGRNESYLLTSAKGPLVAKLFAPESALERIPDALCSQLFDELHRFQPKTLVLPLKHKDTYRLPAATGQHWMSFPFVGPLPSAGKAKPFPIDFNQLIDLFIQVRRDLRKVSSDLLRSLRKHGLVRDVRAIASPDAPWFENPGALDGIKETALQILNELLTTDAERFDGLCHGDLQTGNFVFDTQNLARVVDLDLLSVGPIYSDGLTGLIWRGVDIEILQAFCVKLGVEESRAVASYDVSFAIANGIIWYSAVRANPANPVSEDQINRLGKGLIAAIELHSRLA